VTMADQIPENFEARVAQAMELPLVKRQEALDGLYRELQEFLESTPKP